ncbi:MAG: hypothetical protein ACLGIO_01735 [Acidimicrobiia bacterium]
MTWRAVDGSGLDLATGRSPRWPGHAAPAAALAAAPVVRWPVAVMGDDGRRLPLGAALGPAGDRVQRLLDGLAGARPSPTDHAAAHGAGAGGPDVAALARRTPAGALDLPVDVAGAAEAARAAGRVDRAWLARVEEVRDGLRRRALAAGRGPELEAAVHVAVLLATEWLDPPDDADVDGHVASGALLWLVAGAVAAAVAGAEPDPFEAWTALVAAGWWPVGPSDGRLVVAAAGRR